MYLHELTSNFEIFHELCRLLNERNTWEELAGHMGFTNRKILELRNMESPSDELLTLWGYRNYKVTDLFVLLSRMQHYQALSMLRSLVPVEMHCLLDHGEERLALPTKLEEADERNNLKSHETNKSGANKMLSLPTEMNALKNSANIVATKGDGYSENSTSPVSCKENDLSSAINIFNKLNIMEEVDEGPTDSETEQNTHVLRKTGVKQKEKPLSRLAIAHTGTCPVALSGVKHPHSQDPATIECETAISSSIFANDEKVPTSTTPKSTAVGKTLKFHSKSADVAESSKPRRSTAEGKSLKFLTACS